MKITRTITLPDDAYAQTFGIFGRKGSGKTYAAGKLVEEFIGSGIQTVVIDPLGNWYGLRLDKSGKKPSKLNIPILGGLRGDVPLEVTGGARVADFVVSTGSSFILDVSQFRKNERKRFIVDFGEQLFHLKKSNPVPIHIVFEEAHVFAPQKMQSGQERMLGAMEDIVRLGRNFGIGCSMISQRPQDISTSVRNMCEPLIVFQQIAKHERKAIEDWMEHMGVKSELAELSKLKNGDCFFWSPAWLERFEKTRFLQKKTFDGTSTPKVGETRAELSKLKPVDLDALTAAMAETIEKAALDDPKKLRAKIVQLERQLQTAVAAPVEDPADIEQIVAQAIEARDAEWKQQIDPLVTQRRHTYEVWNRIAEIALEETIQGPPIEGFVFKTTKSATAVARMIQPPNRTSRPAPTPRAATVDRQHRPSSLPDSGSNGLPRGQRIVLTAIAQHGSVGVTRPQLTVLTGYKKTSRTTYLGDLKRDGLIEANGENFHATQAGLDRLGDDFAPLPTGDRLREYWLNRLDRGERAVLAVVVEAYPESVSREWIDQLTGYKKTSRTTYLGKLKARRLVVMDGSGISAAPLLFG